MDASASCGWCKKAGTKRCSRCKKATYCSQICQRNHWKIHKKICKKVNIKTTQQTKQHDIYHRMAQSLQQKKNKTSKSSQNQPNINDIDYEGHILPEDGDEDGIPPWGILRGSIISIYLNKNNINKVPYDIRDISQYVNIKKYNMNSGEYGLLLLKKNDEIILKSPSIDRTKLWYFFKNEQNCNKWLQSIQKILRSIQNTQQNTSKNENYYNDIIVHHGWIVLNKK
eukprot:555759_1